MDAFPNIEILRAGDSMHKQYRADTVAQNYN